jgi:hypothetical protein
MASSGSTATTQSHTGSSAAAPPDGRLWNPVLGFTDGELAEWEKEGLWNHFTMQTDCLSMTSEDRVQWFRSYGEMMRWLEELELRHVEFIRCITSLSSMETAWTTLANQEDREIYSAYARRQASLYRKMRREAAELFAKVGDSRFVEAKAPIPDVVQSFRADELCWFVEMLAEDKARQVYYGATVSSYKL